MSVKESKKKRSTKKAKGDARAHRKAAGEISKTAGKSEKAKPLTQRDVLDAPVPQICPQGGEHEWTEEECSKCHKPSPQADATATKDDVNRGAAKSKSSQKVNHAKGQAK